MRVVLVKAVNGQCSYNSALYFIKKSHRGVCTIRLGGGKLITDKPIEYDKANSRILSAQPVRL